MKLGEKVAFFTYCRQENAIFSPLNHTTWEGCLSAALYLRTNGWRIQESRYHNTMPRNNFLPSIFIGRRDKISHPPSDGIVQIATSGPSCVTATSAPLILDLGNGRTMFRCTSGAGAESAAPATTAALLLAAPFARAPALTPPYKSSPRSDAGFQFTPPTDNARSANGAMAWFKVPNPRSMCLYFQ